MVLRAAASAIRGFSSFGVYIFSLIYYFYVGKKKTFKNDHRQLPVTRHSAAPPRAGLLGLRSHRASSPRPPRARASPRSPSPSSPSSLPARSLRTTVPSPTWRTPPGEPRWRTPPGEPHLENPTWSATPLSPGGRPLRPLTQKPSRDAPSVAPRTQPCAVPVQWASQSHTSPGGPVKVQVLIQQAVEEPGTLHSQQAPRSCPCCWPQCTCKRRGVVSESPSTC